MCKIEIPKLPIRELPIRDPPIGVYSQKCRRARSTSRPCSPWGCSPGGGRSGGQRRRNIALLFSIGCVSMRMRSNQSLPEFRGGTQRTTFCSKSPMFVSAEVPTGRRSWQRPVGWRSMRLMPVDEGSDRSAVVVYGRHTPVSRCEVECRRAIGFGVFVLFLTHSNPPPSLSPFPFTHRQPFVNHNVRRPPSVPRRSCGRCCWTPSPPSNRPPPSPSAGQPPSPVGGRRGMGAPQVCMMGKPIVPRSQARDFM